MNGTVIIGTESLYGCEHILAQKAVSKGVALDIVRCFQRIDEDARRLGHSFKEANPTPGNKKAGITTMAEKAMGALAKAGKASIVGFLRPGEAPKGKGLWIMETRGADVGQISKQAAGGCHILAFTTDLGNPIGLPLVPVFKITANAKTYRENLEDIDIDTSPVILGRMKVTEAGKMIFSKVLDIANGELTKAEVLGFREFAIPRIGSAL
jgi:altronate dehydratase large subunit